MPTSLAWIPSLTSSSSAADHPASYSATQSALFATVFLLLLGPMAGQDMRAATTNFDWLAADSRLVVLGVRDQVARGCQLDEHCPQTRTPDTEVLSRQGAPRLFLSPFHRRGPLPGRHARFNGPRQSDRVQFAPHTGCWAALAN